MALQFYREERAATNHEQPRHSPPRWNEKAGSRGMLLSSQGTHSRCRKEPAVKKDSKNVNHEGRKATTAATQAQPEITIGIDVGDTYSHFCQLDAAGEIVKRGRVPSTQAGLEKQFGKMGRCRIALETGTHCHWMSEVLRQSGHEVIVADAREVKSISGSHRKNDPRDAEQLARLARVDVRLLHPVSLRQRKTQQNRSVLRARDALVECRTQLIGAIRGMVKADGTRLPACSTESFPEQMRESIPEGLRRALAPLMETLDVLNEKIGYYDQLVLHMAQEEYPETSLLTQVPGVGPVTALYYRLTIEDARRFQRSRDVGSYFGLVPKQQDSGESTPQLRISKAGDEVARRLLVSCAHYILGPFGPDSDLRRWGLKLAARGGKNAKKRAIVAVARKLAVLLHRLWSTGEAYEPLRQSGQGEETMVA
jgi:transposase